MLNRQQMLHGALLVTVLLPVTAIAHSIAGGDADFVTSNAGAAAGPFIYLGAKHMVTGYDHLLFLAGVVFFLNRPWHIVQYVSLFALGHSLTLLAGVLTNISINAYLIDAIIGLSVVYKALENMGAFNSLGRWRPDTRWAVFVFGLFHGLGLSASLQELNLHPDGLLINLISFNVGVELGQLTALSMIVIGFSLWRRHPGFQSMAFTSNAILMMAGFTLMMYQLTAWQLNA
jgi:hypothetical protein